MAGNYRYFNRIHHAIPWTNPVHDPSLCDICNEKYKTEDINIREGKVPEARERSIPKIPIRYGYHFTDEVDNDYYKILETKFLCEKRLVTDKFELVLEGLRTLKENDTMILRLSTCQMTHHHAKKILESAGYGVNLWIVDDGTESIFCSFERYLPSQRFHNGYPVTNKTVVQGGPSVKANVITLSLSKKEFVSMRKILLNVSKNHDYRIMTNRLIKKMSNESIHPIIVCYSNEFDMDNYFSF